MQQDLDTCQMLNKQNEILTSQLEKSNQQIMDLAKITESYQQYFNDLNADQKCRLQQLDSANMPVKLNHTSQSSRTASDLQSRHLENEY